MRTSSGSAQIAREGARAYPESGSERLGVAACPIPGGAGFVG
jgi:hypothetical protein